MPQRFEDTYREQRIIGSGTVTGASGPTADHLFGYDKLSQKALERQPTNLNPLYPTYFQFMLERTPKVTYFCQSANLPGMSLNMIEQPTPFVGIPHSAGSPEFEDLTVNFLVDENLTNWLEIWNWMKSASNVKDHSEYIDADEHYSDATLVILNLSLIHISEPTRPY